MRLRRREMVTSATLSSLSRLMRLFPRHDEPCDVEVGDDFGREETVSCSETICQNESIGQETLTGKAITSTSIFLREGSTHLVPASSPELLRRPTNRCSSCRNHLVSRSRHFLKELLKPLPIVIVFAIVIALVDPLKALFLPPSSFVGAACVPIGLICLGNALACLRVRSGEPFPRGATASLALAKMVVTPLIGVGMTQWFAHIGFVHRDDKVLQFVCMCVASVSSSISCSSRLEYAYCMMPTLINEGRNHLIMCFADLWDLY